MTELEILQQLKRKYDAEMVSALIGAVFQVLSYSSINIYLSGSDSFVVMIAHLNLNLNCNICNE